MGTVVELDQKKSNNEQDQDKWLVNIPIIQTPLLVDKSDDDMEKKRWSVNIPILRVSEKKNNEKSMEIKVQKVGTKKTEESEKKEEVLIREENKEQVKPAIHDRNETIAVCNSFERETNQNVHPSIDESLTVSDKITDSIDRNFSAPTSNTEAGRNIK